MPETGSEKRLTHQQKTGFVLLLIFGILTIGLGFVQMRNTIYSPFLLHGITAKEEGRPIHTFYDDLTRLQQIDTDQDGLSDYDEIQFFQTSAYIPDTDSDGKTDKEEIDEGTDPLCPEGTNCDAGATEGPMDTATTTDLSPLGNTAIGPDQLLGEALTTVPVDPEAQPTTEELEFLLSDANYIRQLLLTSGEVTQEQLAALDDDTLLEYAQDILTNYTPTEEAQ